MKQAISIIRGTTNVYMVAVMEESSGSPYVLAEGETLIFGVKSRPGDEEYVIIKTLTADNLLNDSYVLRLNPEDTEDLSYGRYCYDIGLQRGTDYYMVLPCSDFNINHNITERVVT